MNRLEPRSRTREKTAPKTRPNLQAKLTGGSRTARTGRELLIHLLDYEIRGALRYRRFLSVALLEPARGEVSCEMLLDLFRGSDEWLRPGAGRMALVMRETDPAAAQLALERALAQHSEPRDFRCALASYPADGSAGAELLVSAEQRLDSLAATPAAANLDDPPRMG